MFNEVSFIPGLLLKLKHYHNLGNEIIIIDDGSNDGSYEILSKCSFIKLIHLKSNRGKGIALKKGISNASYKAIIVFDGDLELDPFEIEKLMILDKSQNVNYVLGTRFKKSKINFTLWDLGNFFITKIFNIKFNTQIQDSLCCAKSFYLKSLKVEDLVSVKFDIDVEIAIQLILNNENINEIYLNYTRRDSLDGKKLKLKDSFYILKRILS